MNPTLSICIPTYNRAALLQECLQCFVSSAKGFEDRIEIVIIDNASPDHTPEVIASFEKRYGFIRHIRRDGTIEANRNIHSAALAGKGTYLWTFGDDDRVSPGTVATILKELENGYDLIAINHSIWDKSFTNQLNGNVFRMAKDRKVGSHNRMMRALGLRLGYISSIVIRRELFCREPEAEYGRFFDVGFAFLYSVYAGIIGSRRMLVMAAPLVQQRGDNSPIDTEKWYRFFAAGSAQVFRELSMRGYSWMAAAAAKRKIVMEYLIHDISYRRRNGIALEGVKSGLWKNYWEQPFFWLFCLPLLYLPAGMVNALRKMFVRGDPQT